LTGDTRQDGCMQTTTGAAQTTAHDLIIIGVS